MNNGQTSLTTKGGLSRDMTYGSQGVFYISTSANALVKARLFQQSLIFQKIK